MGKFTMPTVKQFLQKKTIWGPKKDPVWVYIEKEMLANLDKKPYNEKVGKWLRFLKDLKAYYHAEAKRQERMLKKEVGPTWYVELSVAQKEVLGFLKHNIYQDEIEDLPNRTRKSLSDLGITLNVSTKILMDAMKNSGGDPGIFIWNLYSAVYKTSPSVLRGEYDMNSMILMSCLVFIDLDECIAALEKLTASPKVPVVPVVEKPKKYWQPKCKYGEYLQRMYVPFYCRHPSPGQQRGERGARPPRPIENKIRLRSDDSYEKLCLDTKFAEAPLKRSGVEMFDLTNQLELRNHSSAPHVTSRELIGQFDTSPFLSTSMELQPYARIIDCTQDGAHTRLEKRLDRNKKAKTTERPCTYKFWEPPSTLRNSDPKMVAYVNKLKMLKQRPRIRHKSAFPNIQFNVGPVAFAGGAPRFLLNNICTLPTGFISIHGGITLLSNGEYSTVISGFWRFPFETQDSCDSTCSCVTKWESTVMEYLHESKCKCHHHYDLYHEGKARERYFHPPSRHTPMFFDKAKIYQLDSMEDFIKDTVRLAVQSGDNTPAPSMPAFSASALKARELLASFLADLSETPLLIPHLPQANLLQSLQEWVRNRVKGKIDPDLHRLLILKSLRRWLWLKHMDFRERANWIPFTLKQLEHMKWSHRSLVGKLFQVLLHDFETRNRVRQLEQTRLWWSTMKYDTYPSKAFLDVYFTYMPGRMKDTYVINPYSSERTPKCGAKTCSLAL